MKNSFIYKKVTTRASKQNTTCLLQKNLVTYTMHLWKKVLSALSTFSFLGDKRIMPFYFLNKKLKSSPLRKISDYYYYFFEKNVIIPNEGSVCIKL